MGRRVFPAFASFRRDGASDGAALRAKGAVGVRRAERFELVEQGTAVERERVAAPPRPEPVQQAEAVALADAEQGLDFVAAQPLRRTLEFGQNAVESLEPCGVAGHKSF